MSNENTPSIFQASWGHKLFEFWFNLSDLKPVESGKLMTKTTDTFGTFV